MPGVLDDNVVILRFDNSDFEKNTEQSMKTLDRLKSSFKDSSSADELTKLGKAVDNINLSRVADGVDRLQRRFSLFGTIGAQAINNLTNYAMSSTKRIITAVPNQIIQGGWKRALNIEQAKFQIEGLKLAWDETSEAYVKGASTIKENVLDAVNGTAYGLDEAAKVAAQFAASGMQAGEEMTNALKGISGVAAMSGSSFEEIGRIFTQVSGQGRLMGDQLLQLSARGMNAAATLANYLHKSESEVREMVSKGQIDFKTFATAMNEAFGEHAKKANDTYTGSLSNMRAALSRIGADVESVKLENLRHIFNALTPVIDQVHVLLGGVINRINKMSTAVSDFAVRGLHSVEWALKPYVDTIKGTTSQLSFMDQIYKHSYQSLTKRQKKATNDMKATAEEAKVAWDIINGGFSDKKKKRQREIEALGLQYKRVQRYTNALVKAGLDEEKCHIKVEGAAKKATKALHDEGEETKKVSKGNYMLRPMVAILGTVANVVNSVKMGFAGVKDVVITTAKTVKTALMPIFGKATTGLFKYTAKLMDSAKKFRTFAKEVSSDKLSKGFKKLSPELQKSVQDFRGKMGNFRTTLQKAVKNMSGYLDQLKARLGKSGVLKTFTDSLKTLGATIKSLAIEKLEKFKPILDNFKNMIKQAVSVDNVANRIEKLTTKFTNFVTGLKTGVDPLNKFLSFFSTFEGKLSGINIAKFGGGLFSDKIKKNALTNLQGAARNLQKADIPGLMNKIAASVNGVTDSVVASQKKLDIKSKVKGILGFFESLDYDKLSSIGLKLSGMVGIFVAVKKMSDVANATVGMLGSISGFFRSLSGIANQVKSSLKVETFRTIAMSVAMLAGSIAVLAMIPRDKLIPATAAIVGLMGIMVSVVALTNSNKFDPNKMRTLGVAFAGMGAAMLALSFACEKIAKLSAGDLLKAGITITAFIGMFVGTSHFAGEIQKSGKSFALMAAAIDMLVFAVTSLAALKFETILEGGTAIMLLMSELGVAARIAKNSNPSGFLGMAIAIDLLVPAIVALAMIPSGMIIKGGLAIVGLMISLAKAAKIAGSSKANMMTMISMTSMVAAAAGALVVLSFVDPTRLLTSATALVSTIAAIAMAADIANQAKKGALAIMGVVTILTAAIVVLVKMDVNKSIGVAASLSVLALGLSKALATFAAIPIVEVLKGLAGLSIAVTGIIALMAGLGGLNKLTNGIAVKGIQSFGDILQAIGEAFGKFTGGFVTGMTSGMPDAGANLSQFITNLQPFLALAKDIKGGSLDGVKNLTDTLKNLTSIDFTQLHTQGKLGNFGADLQILAAQFKAFSKSLEDIPKEDVSRTKSITNIIKTLTDIANAIPAEGGFEQKLQGTKDLGEFGKQMSVALTKTATAITTIGTLTIPEGTDGKVEMITNALKSMSRIAKSLPESGGLIQGIAGNTTITEFANMLKNAIGPINDFMVTISGMTTLTDDNLSRIDTICGVITTMVNAGSKIPPSAGLKQLGTGNTTINEFAVMMNKMCEPLSSFLAKVGMFTDEQLAAAEKIPSIAKAIAWMAWSADKIPESGGIKQAIKGMPDIAKFAEQLADFGPSLSTFMSSISGLTVSKKDVSKIQNISKAMTAIAKLSNSLENSGGMSGAIFGDQDFGAFSDNIKLFGEGVSEFSKYTNNVDPDKITEVANGVSKCVGKLTKIGDIPSGKNIATLGKNVAKFAKSMAGAVTEGLGDKASDISSAVKKLVSSANKAAKNADMKQFAKTGEKAGKEFVKGIKSKHNDSHKAGEGLSNKAKSGIKSAASRYTVYKIGQDIGEGLIDGLASKERAAYEAGYKVGKAAVKGQKDGSNTNSPSKDAIKIGHGIGEGLVIGMQTYERKAYKKGVSLGRASIQGQKDALVQVIDDISSPVITPVLDSSGIKYGLDRLSTDYSVNRAMSINPVSGYDKMASAMEKMLKNQQIRPNVNNINVHVDGSENPEAFASRFVTQFELEMRTG